MRLTDRQRVCAVAFRQWCAEESIDPRLEDILEEAFIAGFVARDGVTPDVRSEPARGAANASR